MEVNKVGWTWNKWNRIGESDSNGVEFGIIESDSPVWSKIGWTETELNRVNLNGVESDRIE